jgi:hypothetical protein
MVSVAFSGEIVSTSTQSFSRRRSEPRVAGAANLQHKALIGESVRFQTDFLTCAWRSETAPNRRWPILIWNESKTPGLLRNSPFVTRTAAGPGAMAYWFGQKNDGDCLPIY